MLDHEALRDELIRQLDEGELKAVTVANRLNIAAPRISELRRRDRRIQPDEMATVADMLGLTPKMPEPVLLAVQLPSVERLTTMMAAMLKSVGLDQAAETHAETLARRLPTALGQASVPTESEPIGEATNPSAPAQHRSKPTL